jgi:hypothetical protein
MWVRIPSRVAQQICHKSNFNTVGFNYQMSINHKVVKGNSYVRLGSKNDIRTKNIVKRLKNVQQYMKLKLNV